MIKFCPWFEKEVLKMLKFSNIPKKVNLTMKDVIKEAKTKHEVADASDLECTLSGEASLQR